jgi:DNA-binding MarR family transcriptional regulator
MSTPPAGDPLEDRDYQDLLVFRNELRQFLRWSENRARDAGLTPALHQLLLVLRGDPTTNGPTITDLADALQMRHHSAVELVKRAEAAGLISRQRDDSDHRRVHLHLTNRGRRQLELLTREHLPRVHVLAHTLQRTLPPNRDQPGRST